MVLNIDDLTYGQIKQIKSLMETTSGTQSPHPMLNRRCLIRTYSAGVHIGDVVRVDGTGDGEGNGGGTY